MDLYLKDKHVVITGSSRGLGKVIASRYLEEGASVCLVARGEEMLRNTEQEFVQRFGREKVRATCSDLTTEKGIQHFVEFVLQSLGSVDILIANAGFSRGSSGIDIGPDDWKKLLDANLVGPALVVGAFQPLLKKTKGNVILISSIAGREALPAPIPYSVSKLGLAAFMKNASREFAHDGIRINTVCPGNIFLDGGIWEKKQKENRQAVASYIMSEVPLKRFATGEEIADAVLFLSSQRSSFTTGASLVIDGGQTRGFF